MQSNSNQVFVFKMKIVTTLDWWSNLGIYILEIWILKFVIFILEDNEIYLWFLVWQQNKWLYNHEYLFSYILESVKAFILGSPNEDYYVLNISGNISILKTKVYK